MTTTHETRRADSEALRGQLADNLEQFELLVSESERDLRRGRLERSAMRAQLAATFAWFNHPGLFASQRLERILTAIGEALHEDSSGPDLSTGAGGLLHVATAIHQTGGHTQMIANWMTTDTTHTHRLCVTHQAGAPIPAKVTAALAPDEDVHRLDDEADTFLGRARALRRLARTADVVVLHVHPNDVVAAIALAGQGTGQPVLLINHADHVFWVGAGIASTVVNLRRSGQRLTIERRGVPAERNGVLIRPLLFRERETGRAEARARLGLPAGRVLLVTAAAGSKYEPVGGSGFLDLLEPVLDDFPEAFLVAGGPDPTGRWRRLEKSGRGQALGLLSDAHPLLEAADVYLDSFPFSSLTSLLEAGSLGTPVVTVRPPDDGADVLGADTPELDDDMLVARGPDELRGILADLVRNPEMRTRIGSATAAAIQDAHAGSAWARQVARLCAADGPRRPSTPAGPDVVCGDALDQRVALVQQRTGLAQGLLGTLALNSGYLPWRERIGVYVALARADSPPRPSLLLAVRSSRRLRRVRARSAAWTEQWRARTRRP